MREKYESLALTDLKAIAKGRGIKGTSTMKKADIVEAMLAEDEKDKAAGKEVALLFRRRRKGRRKRSSRRSWTAALRPVVFWKS